MVKGHTSIIQKNRYREAQKKLYVLRPHEMPQIDSHSNGNNQPKDFNSLKKRNNACIISCIVQGLI